MYVYIPLTWDMEPRDTKGLSKESPRLLNLLADRVHFRALTLRKEHQAHDKPQGPGPGFPAQW